MTDTAVDGGQFPSRMTIIGGKGADGLAHALLVTDSGSLVIDDAELTIDPTNLATSAKQDTLIATAGATTGAAVVADANGTIQQYLRGLVKLIAAIITVKIDQTTPGSTNGVQTKQYAGVPSSFAIQTSDQTVFTLAAGEIGFIQNFSADAPLAVKKGASASTTSLSFILPMRAVAGDAGSGGAVKIDDWVGVVSVAKMTGTASYVAYKQAVA